MSNKFNIFAIVFLAISTFAGVAKAENAENLDNKIFLAQSTNAQFEGFMNKKAKRFVRKNNEDWVTFKKVIRLYNESQGQFAKMNEDEQADFYAASASIKEKLDKMWNKDSEKWLEKVEVTEKVFAFLWSNKVPERTLENVNLQALKAESAISR